MSKLEELIEELCPDGVEYKAIWEVTIWDKKFNSVDRGKQPQIISYPYLLAKDMFALEQKIGDVFLLSTGEQTGWTTVDKAGDFLCEGEVVTIPWGKSRKVVDVMKYYKGKFVTADNRLATSNDITVLNNKYLYYWMMTQGDVIDSFYRGSGLKHPNMKDVLDMCIPIPPLPVQEEIVRILDNFTDITAELQAKLQAELQARAKQYEYYRDRLLTFGDDVPRVKIGDIATDIYRGAGIKRDEVTEEGISCVRYGEIYTSYNISFDTCLSHTNENVVASPKYFEYGDIIFAITGESVEEIAKSIVYLGNEKCMAGGDTVVLKHNQEPRYMSYVLSTTDAQMQKSKGKVKSKVVHSSVPSIKEIEIALPSFETQKKIADILDNFRILVNDIVTGLPAEIEARQKQYEYYRNKLLTYKGL